MTVEKLIQGNGPPFSSLDSPFFLVKFNPPRLRENINIATTLGFPTFYQYCRHFDHR